MSTILTHAIISKATEAVDSYVSSANELKNELDGILSTLTTNNFNGDASNGYRVFYDKTVVPALTTNLTEPGSSIMAGIKSMLETIQEQLLDQVDPQLGENNQNPGGGN